MNNAIRRMLQNYDLTGIESHELALREILQEVALVGLWRAKFFEHAAFYGGTALRILYQLDRFSEDLDFTLLTPTPTFSWDPYAKFVTQELASYGFVTTMEEKQKTKTTAIRSAFLKSNTVQELLRIGVKHPELKNIHPSSLIRIKVEIDTKPSVAYGVEHQFLQNPIPIPIQCVTEEYLFAGKTHAAFFRAWKGRVKGRDWYDLVWFIRRDIPLNLQLFSNMMGEEKPLTKKSFLELSRERIDSLDIESAKKDILNFVHDHESINAAWSKEFFLYWIDRIQFSCA